MSLFTRFSGVIGQSRALLRNDRVVQCSRRNGGNMTYRKLESGEGPYGRFTAELFGGLFWWWVLWKFYHEFEHVTGHYTYPDVTKWTNEELGIPPDNED